MAILSRPGAWPFYLAIFINAAVDLGHKITLQNTVFKVHSGGEQIALIAAVNGLILLPYIVFFVPVGRLNSRLPKPRVMRIAAWVSLALTLCIYAFYHAGYFWPAFAATFLMAVQSAFYSPAKLSYLKVMFGRDRLSAANGLAQAVVIVAILAATLLFSLAFENRFNAAGLVHCSEQQLVAYASVACSKSQVLAQMPVLASGLIVMAVLQLVLVYRIPFISEGTSNAEHAHLQPQQPSNVTGNRDEYSPRDFWVPVLGLALFWSVGQGMLAVFPAFAKSYAGITNTAVIQGVLACTAAGLALGAAAVGYFSQQQVVLGWALGGIVLIAAGAITLPYLTNSWQFAANYFVLGLASGMLLVPLNAYLQLKASATAIAEIIARSNLYQNIAMLMMLVTTLLVALAGFDSRTLLQAIAVFVVVAGAFISLQIRKL